MTLLMKCGLMPTAKGHNAYCPVCARLYDLDPDAPDYDEQRLAILDRAEHIRKSRAAYGRRRRHP